MSVLPLTGSRCNIVYAYTLSYQILSLLMLCARLNVLYFISTFLKPPKAAPVTPQYVFTIWCQ